MRSVVFDVGMVEEWVVVTWMWNANVVSIDFWYGYLQST